ncbi:MAG: FecR domain-containing protein [Rhodospirillaceae bacterium]|nr:FecR domain-containing protein [Rhodospirillaceae bacterium]
MSRTAQFVFVVFLSATFLAAALQAQAAEVAGTVERLRGAVAAERDGARRTLGQGAAVFVGDRLTTGGDSRLEVRFVDGTVVTLGDRSDLVVDRFLYDPPRDAGDAVLQLANGVFRAASGGISKLRGAPLKIETPTGTLGIRGTEFWGEQRADSLLVALLGGGGAFVENVAGRTEIGDIGYATKVEAPGQAPSPAFALTAEQIEAALATVAW